MEVTVVVAGVLSILLGIGHESIGLKWVLPNLERESLPQTPFGPKTMTDGMIRVTWHIVTIFALTSGVVLLMLAAAETSDARTLLLRSFAVMWLAATVMAAAVVRPTLKKMSRLPVPLIWIVVAVLCWVGST